MNEDKPAYEVIFNNAIPWKDYKGSLDGKWVVVNHGVYYVVDPKDTTTVKCE